MKKFIFSLLLICSSFASVGFGCALTGSANITIYNNTPHKMTFVRDKSHQTIGTFPTGLKDLDSGQSVTVKACVTMILYSHTGGVIAYKIGKNSFIELKYGSKATTAKGVEGSCKISKAAGTCWASGSCTSKYATIHFHITYSGGHN